MGKEENSELSRVDDTGIEPVTPTMSMWCSTAEPIVLGVRTIQHKNYRA
jgi:hypothetical protein